MSKRFLSILIFGLIALTQVANAAHFNSNDTSNATFEAVDGGTDKIVLKKIGISVGTDGPDTITVKCDSTTKIGPLYFAANSGIVLESEGGVLSKNALAKCAGSEDLDITKGTAGTDVTVWGEYELDWR